MFAQSDGRTRLESVSAPRIEEKNIEYGDRQTGDIYCRKGGRLWGPLVDLDRTGDV